MSDEVKRGTLFVLKGQPNRRWYSWYFVVGDPDQLENTRYVGCTYGGRFEFRTVRNHDLNSESFNKIKT